MDNLLIYKYLSGTATEDEIILLFQWVEASPKNKSLFIKYKKAWALTATSNNKKDWIQIQNSISVNINNINDSSNRFTSFYKYAAIFICLVGMTFVLKTVFNTSEKLNIVDKDVILQLGSGVTEIVSSNEGRNILNESGEVIGVQEIGVLNYNVNNSLDKSLALNNFNLKSIRETELIYNELHVPHGKRFRVILSDGTIAHLNAGTSLKYPINFIKGKNREVFVDGEAYFDVVEDIKHPFIVNASDLKIRVLGTKFNVSTYSENPSINTVLLEGSVALYKSKEFKKENATLLEPGFKAASYKDKIELTDVDTDNYIAWMDGKVIFKDTPFYVIRKALERLYNVTIINNNKVLDKNTYNVFFDGESIEQILETLNTNLSIDYIIKNNQVIIN